MYSAMHPKTRLVRCISTSLRTCQFRAHTQFFLRGKGSLAPNGGNTIPGMELCAAVLGIEVADIIKEQLGIPSECFRYYTDSQIVLGYLTNTIRGFYVYVSNGVKRVHSSSSPTQWTHVATEQNPADLATRSVCATQLSSSMWLTRPPFRTLTKTFVEPPSCFPLVEPNNDCEIRPEVTCSKVQVNDVKFVNSKIGSERFLRFSTWESLVRGVKLLKQFIYLIRSEIKSCVTCRKLRGSFGWQKMADLPEDRIQPTPPFSYVGVDTVGPWTTTQLPTRGETVNQKRWDLMFTCLVS